MPMTPTEARRVSARTSVKAPGDFWIGDPDKRTGLRKMNVLLPGHSAAVELAIIAGPSKLASVFGWNGDAERPTLTPHITAATTDDVRWRGYLRNGVLTPMP